jgi:hypothetical protein
MITGHENEHPPGSEHALDLRQEQHRLSNVLDDRVGDHAVELQRSEIQLLEEPLTNVEPAIGAGDPRR